MEINTVAKALAWMLKVFFMVLFYIFLDILFPEPARIDILLLTLAVAVSSYGVPAHIMNPTVLITTKKGSYDD